MLNDIRRRRRAFSLLELIATVAVLSILAAAIVPGTVAYLARKRAETAVTILLNLESAIERFRTNSFAAGTTFYPGRLSHLTRSIGTEASSCTGIGAATPLTNYNGTATGNWVNLYEGPYYSRTIPSSGLPIGIGVASDTVFRTSGKGVAGNLQIFVRGVTFEDAGEVNDIVDGTAEADQGNRSNTTGKVQWGIPTSDEYVTLVFQWALISGGTGC